MNTTRVPSGVPAGGQFAEQAKSEADVCLEQFRTDAEQAHADMTNLDLDYDVAGSMADAAYAARPVVPNRDNVTTDTASEIVACPTCGGPSARAALCRTCDGSGTITQTEMDEIAAATHPDDLPGLHAAPANDHLDGCRPGHINPDCLSCLDVINQDAEIQAPHAGGDVDYEAVHMWQEEDQYDSFGKDTEYGGIDW